MKPTILLFALTPLLLSGCVSTGVAVGTEAGLSLAEERSIGTKIDDVTLYTDINRLFMREPTNDLFADITVDVRHGRVLLTGNVQSEAFAQRAVALAWQAKGVEEVINELIVNPAAGLVDSAKDNITKKNLEARLLVTKDVWVINYSINVVNGSAYLLGRVHDQPEMNRVLNVARTTKGVRRVVNHLQVRPQNDPVQPAAAMPSSAPVPNSTVSQPYNGPATSMPPATLPAPAASGNLGSDGYAAPELISSQPLPPAN